MSERVARIHVKDGPVDSWPVADKVARGWQSGVMFYPDEQVVEVLHEYHAAPLSFLADEVIQIIDETSDSQGNVHVDALVARIRHEVEDCDCGQHDDPEDPEEFCDRCAAGVWSDEHHDKCVVAGFAEDGESAVREPSDAGGDS